MNVVKFQLSQDQINEISRIAASEAVKAYRSEETRAQRISENQKIGITKSKLKAYRRVKASLEETEEFTDYEKIEMRWDFVRDLMGSGLDAIDRADDRIRSVEYKRKKDAFEVQLIDRAISLYKKEVDISSTAEDKRRYRELYAMYIDDEPKDVKEIAQIENISEKIVYRDIGIALKILTMYLLGM